MCGVLWPWSTRGAVGSHTVLSIASITATSQDQSTTTSCLYKKPRMHTYTARGVYLPPNLHHILDPQTASTIPSLQPLHTTPIHNHHNHHKHTTKTQNVLLDPLHLRMPLHRAVYGDAVLPARALPHGHGRGGAAHHSPLCVRPVRRSEDAGGQERGGE